MNRFHKTVICIICCMNSHQLFADDSGFYVGGSIGYANLPAEDLNNNVNGLTQFNIKQDKEGLSWKLVAGYHLNKYFGAEFTFIRVEDNDIDFTLSGTVNGTISSDIRTDGYKFAATVRYPLTEKLDVFANLGPVIVDESEEVKLIPGTGLSRANDSVGVSYGTGIRYKLGSKIALRIELEGGGPHPAVFYSSGLEYRF